MILAQMYEQGYISADEFAESYGNEIVLNPDDSVVKTGVHSWYVDMVINDVIDDLRYEKGVSKKAANALVFGGALVDSYDGDFDTVVGLSMTLLKRLCEEITND